MSETEKRYAQIEKEALAVAWACDMFANYILGGSLKWNLTTNPSSHCSFPNTLITYLHDCGGFNFNYPDSIFPLHRFPESCYIQSTPCLGHPFGEREILNYMEVWNIS